MYVGRYYVERVLRQHAVEQWDEDDTDVRVLGESNRERK